MKHRIEILAAFAILAGLGLATWLLASGPLADHFRSQAEFWFGMLAMMVIPTAIVTGIVVGVWDASQEAPPKRLPHRLRPLHHH